MGSATVRHDDEDDEEYQEAYWRRRAIALGGVVLVVGGLAWTCSGGGGDEKAPAGAKEKSAEASPSPSVSGTEASPLELPTVLVTVTKTATVAAPRRPGDACEPRDVVVTLIPAAREFPPGVQPTFSLTVVNTGRLDCTFDVGAQSLVTRITSGSDRIWSSAHCEARGLEATSIQRLRRGVPYTTTLVWDRRRSDKGCDGPRTKALPGTYTAQVQGGGVKTEKTVFELAEGGRRRG